MLLIHEYCYCLNCGEKLEIFTYDIEGGQVDCPECGYSNELNDIRLDIWEEEF